MSATALDHPAPSHPDGGAVAAPAAVDDFARQDQDRASEYRMLMRKFWFAALISIPVVVLSYPALFGLVRWAAFEEGSDSLLWIWRALGVASIPVLAWSGSQFYAGAWHAVGHRSANMHTLIAIGISAAWLYSTVASCGRAHSPRSGLRRSTTTCPRSSSRW